ncbi:hypothetical protein CALVIDRAFT_539593, partial [Calocera viscosa TUFC12733]
MPPLRAPSLLDYAQRGISTGLALLTAYGLYEMVVVHEHTMKAGEQALAKRTKEMEALAAANAREEEKMVARAEAAQAVSKPSPS